VSDTAVVGSETSAAKPATPVPPKSVKWAMAAVVVQVVFALTRVFSMFGYTDQLKHILSKDLATSFRRNLSNYFQDFGEVLQGKRKTATLKDLAYDDLDKALHAVRINGLWQGLVVAVALFLLAYSLRRPATASVTRWALLIVMVLTGGPFTVIPAKGLPVVPQVALVLAGLASIVAIVLLFVPQSRAYFKQVSDLRRAAIPTGTRPRLFGGASGEPKPIPTSGLRSTAASRAQARSAKAKSRNDAEAIARGAELARNRAKASKSRRGT